MKKFLTTLACSAVATPRCADRLRDAGICPVVLHPDDGTGNVLTFS